MDNSVCKGPTDITVGWEAIERVDDFENLSSLIDNKADVTSEIKRRFAIANGKLRQFDKLWLGLNAATKLRVLRSCIFSVATYGCKTCILNF